MLELIANLATQGDLEVMSELEREYRDELVRIKVAQGYRDYAAQFDVQRRPLKDVIATVENYRRLRERSLQCADCYQWIDADKDHTCTR